MRAFLYTGLFVILIVTFGHISHAQVLGSLATVQVTLNPEHPQPGQAVRATVSSPSEDVRAATIVWLLDDEIQQQGAGGVDFTFIVGEIGSSKTLGVLVQTQSGQVLTKTITIKPSQVTLLWEGDTYTPPFYNGRPLYSAGSLVRAEAVANFVKSNGDPYRPSELIYKWSKNGTVLGSLSGVNATSIVTEGPKFFGEYILSVEVATPDGTQVARSAARVETLDPVVKLYERDPLIGIQYHRALGANHIFSGSSQIAVQAVPYFMDIIHENDDYLDYSWYVNNIEVLGEQESPSILNIQLSTEDNITTRIRISIEHALHLLQIGKGDFEVTLEGSVRNSLFGL